MSADILVVYKKNFEAVHDRSIDSIEKVLQKFVNEQGVRVDMTAREKVRRSDFIGRDLVYYDQGPQGGGRKLEANLVSPTSGMHLHTYTRDSDNSGAMVGYVDATQVDTGASTIDISAPEGYIGRLNNGAEDLNGRIACIRMYKGVALSQAQVTQNFNAQRERFGL